MMDSTDVTTTMGNKEISIIHNDYSEKQRFYLGVKLILLGLLLPAVDVGTDFYAIYQYWTSSQWIHECYAKGLAFSIFCHNFVSTWYRWRNWPDPPAWNFGILICFSLDFGAILLAMEILVDITWKKNFEAR